MAIELHQIAQATQAEDEFVRKGRRRIQRAHPEHVARSSLGPNGFDQALQDSRKVRMIGGEQRQVRLCFGLDEMQHSRPRVGAIEPRDDGGQKRQRQ